LDSVSAPHPLIWIGFLAFFVVGLVVGVRLLWLGLRGARLPELCIGAGVLGIGPVGFGILVLAQRLADTHPTLQVVLFHLSLAAVATGVSCKLIFNWRVYHPESRWLGWVVAVAGALLALALAGSIASGRSYSYELDWSFFTRMPLQVGALLWGSAEALRYWGQMRRRVRLGLADPVVCNRFLLWGIGAGAAGVGSLIGVVAQIAHGQPNQQIPWVLASSSLHGLVAAVALWLAFVPPAAYTRWVERREAARA
jgi:hypothetical protein